MAIQFNIEYAPGTTKEQIAEMESALDRLNKAVAARHKALSDLDLTKKLPSEAEALAAVIAVAEMLNVVSMEVKSAQDA